MQKATHGLLQEASCEPEEEEFRSAEYAHIRWNAELSKRRRRSVWGVWVGGWVNGGHRTSRLSRTLCSRFLVHRQMFA